MILVVAAKPVRFTLRENFGIRHINVNSVYLRGTDAIYFLLRLLPPVPVPPLWRREWFWCAWRPPCWWCDADADEDDERRGDRSRWRSRLRLRLSDRERDRGERDLERDLE
jgi:hypothetical protein